MISANTFTITINGQPAQARSGQTILQTAEQAGVYIPTLCHHPHLRPEGSCRMCVVEIEKFRGLQPACTCPASPGMVVQTESEKVVESRRFVLQMLFSERGHYCMACPMSGSVETTDCELQRLGYRYGLNFWEYAPDYASRWPVDATDGRFALDHNRCVLCRRCVRACADLAANHTLGLHHRGARAMIGADDDVPLAESSCIACGACVQVCPTGALVDRRSAFAGHDAQVQRTSSTCTGCAVGCGIEAITRDNQALRVDGDWNASNGGLLCSKGRYDSLNGHLPRILWPMLRRGDGTLVETSWDKALALVSERFGEAHRVAGLISPRMTTGLLEAFVRFFHETLESNDVGLLYGEVPPLDLGRTGTLPEIAGADCIVVIGGDPLEEQKVAGYLIKRAYHGGAARIIVVNSRPTGLDAYARLKLHLEDLAGPGESPFAQLDTTYHLSATGLSQIREAVEAASRPVVLYGPDLSATVYTGLRGLPAKARFIPLAGGGNAIGAARAGLNARAVRGDAVYVVLGDDAPEVSLLPQQRKFLVVQAAHRSAWTEAADVVLPSRAWAEQKGHVVNLEMRSLPVRPSASPPASVHPDWETLLQLSVRLGYALAYEQIADLVESV